MIERLGINRFLGWKLQRNPHASGLRTSIYKVLAIVFSLLIAGLLLTMIGEDPIKLGSSIVKSTLGTKFGIKQMFILATPLILTGTAVTLAGRMEMWNMGGEGQLLIGAWAATGIGLFLDGIIPGIPILIFLAAMASGAFFALIPAYLRARAGISEILTTILLNYVAYYWVVHFTGGPWKATTGTIGAFRTEKIPFQLPSLFEDLHIGILIAIAIVIILTYIMRSSVWGYELTSIGDNQRVARFAGIPVERQMLIVMLISGAIAGLSGAIEVTGVGHRLTPLVSVSYAWNGLTVSILAGTSFFALIPYGLFMAVLLNGGIVLKTAGLSHHLVFALTGIILVLAAVGEVAANYKFIKIEDKSVVGQPETEITDHNGPN